MAEPNPRRAGQTEREWVGWVHGSPLLGPQIMITEGNKEAPSPGPFNSRACSVLLRELVAGSQPIRNHFLDFDVTQEIGNVRVVPLPILVRFILAGLQSLHEAACFSFS